MEAYTLLKFGDFCEISGKSKVKLACFDLDHTLITPNGKHKFPKTIHDWKWKDNFVKIKLAKLSNDYHIIIISNQKKLFGDDLKTKIQNIYNDLQIPFLFVCGHSNEFYRKPHTALWKNILVKQEFKHYKIDKNNSFFVGDMYSDACFAFNNKLTFYDADEYFKDSHTIKPKSFDNDKHPLYNVLSDKQFPELTFIKDKSKKYFVLMVGSPASGKSSISRNTLKNFVRINRDELKTESKMMSICKKAIQEEKNIVIDNTNPTKEIRKKWFDVAKTNDYTTIILWINLEKPVVSFLNHYRVETDKNDKAFVPEIAFRVYFSRLETPNTAECDMIFNIDKIYCHDDCSKFLSYWF